MNSSLIKILSGNEFKGIDRIEIPQIQRDYAQGRLTQKATDIRHSFLDNIMAVVMTEDSSSRLHLDFIYGYKGENKAFEPLDGQQRLTTIFLFHWLLSPTGNKDLVYIDKDNLLKSKLRYCTRNSSTDFCDFLVNKNAADYMAELKTNRKEIKEKLKLCEDKDEKSKLKAKLKSITLSGAIKNSEEFQWNWWFDPTVIAMLNMLDAMESHLMEYNVETPSKYYENLRSRITMDFQDLEELEFGKSVSGTSSEETKVLHHQGYELYVKMNSRGLELSDFDITKSIFEEELIDQNAEEFLQQTWRKLIDKDWADFFWQHYNRSNGGKGEADIELVEKNFRNFILQEISLDWFVKLYNFSTHTDKQASIYALTLNSSEDIDRIIPQYRNFLFRERHEPNIDEKYQKIDFYTIIKRINSILVKEKETKIINVLNEYSGETNREIVDSFIYPLFNPDSTHIDRVLFWAITKFAVLFKAPEKENVDTHGPQSTSIDSAKHYNIDEKLFRENLRKWMRFIYHISILVNNTDRISTNKDEYKVISGVSCFLTTFKESSILNIDEFIIENRIEGFSIANIEEEQLKYKLKKKDIRWNDVIEEAENFEFFKGQIRALIDWSKISDKSGEIEYDIAKFKKYFEYFVNLYNTYKEGVVTIADVRGALLATNDPSYPMNDYLLDFSEHRDKSIKRYLREKKDSQAFYGSALKEMFDEWICRYPEMKAEKFLSEYIKVHTAHAADWKKKLIMIRGEIDNYTNTGRVFETEDGWMLGNALRSDSHLYSLDLLYYKATELVGRDVEVKDNIATNNPNSIIDRQTGEVIYRL